VFTWPDATQLNSGYVILQQVLETTWQCCWVESREQQAVWSSLLSDSTYFYDLRGMCDEISHNTHADTVFLSCHSVTDSNISWWCPCNVRHPSGRLFHRVIMFTTYSVYAMYYSWVQLKQLIYFFFFVGRCGVVGSTLAFGSTGHGFESEHRLFSHHGASAFSIFCEQINSIQ